VKTKMHWRDTRDTRNMEHLTRKDMGNNWASPIMWCSWRRQASEVFIQSPYALGVRHGLAGFNVYPLEFWSCFGPFLPFCYPISPFWNKNVYTMALCIGNK
jgi:hypothetical protein